MPFTELMPSWPPGPRPSDGIWPSYWDTAVWSSTVFEAWEPRTIERSERDSFIAEACRRIYAALHARRGPV